VSDQSELTFEIEVMPDSAIVRCRGALTLTSAGRLRHEVKCLPLTTRVITVDFTELTMIDSFGLGTMAALYVSARNAGRTLHVVNLGPRVREVFSVSRLLSLFESAGEANVRIP
jgi:anti-anti-sigma factor